MRNEQRFSAADIKRARKILKPSNRVPWLYLGYLVCVAVLAFAGGWLVMRYVGG